MTLENLKYAYRDIMINPLKIIFFNSIYLGGIKTKLSKNETFAAGEMTERKCIILFYLKTNLWKKTEFWISIEMTVFKKKACIKQSFQKTKILTTVVK